MRFEKNSNLLTIYVPLALFLISFLWKLFYIEQRDICLDEPYTIHNAQRSILEILRIPAQGEPSPPLFMLLMHFWIRLFGTDAAMVRLLPLIFNAITTLFIYFIGKRFFSSWASLLASGLFIFSNYHFFHGIEARTYSLLSMATAASLYFYLQYAEDENNKKALVGLVLSNLFLVYAHYFGWFVVFSQFLASFVYIRNWKMFFRFLLPSILTGIGFLPMMGVIIKQFMVSKRGTWLDPPRSIDYIEQIYHFLNHPQVFNAVLIVFALGVVFFAALYFFKKRASINKGIVVLLIWWLVPYSIMFFVSNYTPMFNSRYILFNTIGLYLFIAAMVNFLYQNNKYFEPIAGLLIIVVMAVNMRILPEYFSHREINKSVEWVKNHENDSSIVILFPYWSDLAFTYHYNRKIFNEPVHYYDTLMVKKIFPVWGLPHARMVLDANPHKRVLYLQDGPYTNHGEQPIFDYLDSLYVQIDNHVLPQTYHMGAFDVKGKPQSN